MKYLKYRLHSIGESFYNRTRSKFQMTYTIMLAPDDLARVESALYMRLNQKIKEKLMYDARNINNLLIEIEKQRKEQSALTL